MRLKFHILHANGGDKKDFCPECPSYFMYSLWFIWKYVCWCSCVYSNAQREFTGCFVAIFLYQKLVVTKREIMSFHWRKNSRCSSQLLSKNISPNVTGKKQLKSIHSSLCYQIPNHFSSLIIVPWLIIVIIVIQYSISIWDWLWSITIIHERSIKKIVQVLRPALNLASAVTLVPTLAQVNY